MVKYIKSSTSGNVFLLEVGVLLDETNSEYDDYATAYDRKHGFFDEGQSYVLGLDSAIEKGKAYVQEGVKNTYAVVSKTDVTNEDVEYWAGEDVGIEWMDVSEDYLPEDVVYSVYKDENGNLIEDFIEK